MRRTTAKKLTLSRETLHELNPEAMRRVAAGDDDWGWSDTLKPTKICPQPSLYTGCAACIENPVDKLTNRINPAPRF